MKEELRIAITGYRPTKLPAKYGYDIYNPAYMHLGSAIRDTILYAAYRRRKFNLVCISGMALGTDQLFVHVASRLKQTPEFENVHITAAIPCYGQETKWPVKSRETYHKILSLCDESVHVTQGGFTPSCMEERNQWMVDRCDILIAVYDGKPGGTANCIRYARQKNKAIYYIDPVTLRIQEAA